MNPMVVIATSNNSQSFTKPQTSDAVESDKEEKQLEGKDRGEQQKVDKKKSECEQCGKAFVTVSNRNMHVKSVHDKERHECEQCGKTFTTATYRICKNSA